MTYPFKRFLPGGLHAMNDVPRIFMWEGAYGFKSLCEKSGTESDLQTESSPVVFLSLASSEGEVLWER